MADCNKFKKKWMVETSDTNVFVVGCEYRIRKASEGDSYEIEFITDPPPNPDGFSTLTCETSEDGDTLVGIYTDTEGHQHPAVMYLTDNDKKMNGAIADLIVEGTAKPPDEVEEPVGTWNAEEEPPEEQ